MREYPVSSFRSTTLAPVRAAPELSFTVPEIECTSSEAPAGTVTV